MICDICKKKKATVHFTEVVNEEVSELHLCQECAETQGAQMQQHFSIADLLSGLVDFPLERAAKKEHITIKCPNCGMGYSDFKKMGRFGCAHCYEVFKRALYPLLKKIHGTARHIGKQPKQVPPKKRAQAKVQPKARPKIPTLEELKTRLQQAIKNEEFEEAAVLRDRIRVLQTKDNKKD